MDIQYYYNIMNILLLRSFLFTISRSIFYSYWAESCLVSSIFQQYKFMNFIFNWVQIRFSQHNVEKNCTLRILILNSGRLKKYIVQSKQQGLLLPIIAAHSFPANPSRANLSQTLKCRQLVSHIMYKQTVKNSDFFPHVRP